MKVTTTKVSFPSTGGSTPAFLATPQAAGRFPGLVVIQEWWGLVPHIEAVTRRFAESGFVALAPDLYHGEAAEEPDEARKLAMALDRERAVNEILAAASFLTRHERVLVGGIGVVGWCMGGGLALSAAAEGDDLAAAVCFYGRPLAESDCARLEVPVLGLFAGHDHGISLEEVRAFEADLQAHGVAHEVHVYEAAHHAFFNDTRPVYDPEAAADAWRRTLDWFGRFLPAPTRAP